MKAAFDRLAARLGIVIDFREEVPSTNDLARDARYGHGDVVAAGAQIAGRGQQGNRWASEPGKNMTFSMIFTPDFLSAGDQFYLLQAVSLAVADTLREYGLDPRIKWPNDIYVGERKIAGLLIENDVCGMHLARSIAGIGLNVNQREFPAWVPNPTSVLLETGRQTDLAGLLEKLYFNLSRRYGSLERREVRTLSRDYLDALYRLGTPHRYSTPEGGVFEGVIRGVGPAGELHVEHLPDGGMRTYLFKEIEFR